MDGCKPGSRKVSGMRPLIDIVTRMKGRLFGAPSQQRSWTRYDTLQDVFERQTARKRNILEIGTHNGHTAVSLLRRARHHEPIEAINYYGFDLFEDLDDDLLRHENSKKSSGTTADVRDFIALEAGIDSAQIHLYKGFTKNTLWRHLGDLPKMDFIFIDGGHSFETVENDWRACSELMHGETVVIFDDYYHFQYGPRLVVDQLDTDVYDVELLTPQQEFQDRFGVSPDGVLRINLAQVSLK